MNNSVSPSAPLYRSALQTGYALSAVYIAYILLTYVINEDFMVHNLQGVLGLVLSLGLLIYLGIKYRNSSAEAFPFSAAYKYSYIALAVAGVTGSLFGILLFQVVDRELSTRLLGIIEEKLLNQGLGADEVENAMRITRWNFSLAGQSVVMLAGLVFYLLLALIPAWIIRKPAPKPE